MSDYPTLSVAEYQTALRERRALQSRLIQADLAALRAEITKLQTAAGRAEQRRRVQPRAKKTLENARLAGLIAGQHMVANIHNEPDHVGRERIEAAAAEVMGITVEEFRRREIHNDYQRQRKTPAPATAPVRDPYEGRHGWPDTWDEGCRCLACKRAHRNALDAGYKKAKREAKTAA